MDNPFASTHRTVEAPIFQEISLEQCQSFGRAGKGVERREPRGIAEISHGRVDVIPIGEQFLHDPRGEIACSTCHQDR